VAATGGVPEEGFLTIPGECPVRIGRKNEKAFF
jgi:hypothetical protein